MKKDINIAIVHDFLTAYGGAERVLEVFTEMFPGAPIYTLLYDKEKMRGKFESREVHTSFLQKFPRFLRKRKKLLLPFMLVAPETFDLRDYDLVITSSGAWSKGIVTRLNTKHISYMHSPMRFAWDENENYLRDQGGCFLRRFFIRAILSYVRLWDKMAADRPDHIIANSKFTQERIKRYYGRESEVIYPPAYAEASAGKPVDKLRRPTSKALDVRRLSDKHFLIISRLSPYKKVDVVVEAFNKLELPLVVIGEGEQEKYLRQIANKNIKILGWQPDEEMEKYYQHARAFIFPCVDDFGLAPVEAMAHGVPVIAVRQGGIREAVEEGKTGEFFESATQELIADGVRRFMEREDQYDKEYIKRQVERFRKERFKIEIGEFIDNKLKGQNSNLKITTKN